MVSWSSSAEAVETTKLTCPRLGDYDRIKKEYGVSFWSRRKY